MECCDHVTFGEWHDLTSMFQRESLRLPTKMHDTLPCLCVCVSVSRRRLFNIFALFLSFCLLLHMLLRLCLLSSQFCQFLFLFFLNLFLLCLYLCLCLCFYLCLCLCLCFYVFTYRSLPLPVSVFLPLCLSLSLS